MFMCWISILLITQKIANVNLPAYVKMLSGGRFLMLRAIFSDEDTHMLRDEVPAASTLDIPNTKQLFSGDVNLKCGDTILKKNNVYLRSEEQGGGYPHNYNCTYILRPKNSHGGIYILTNYFSLENSTDCSADFLEVSGLGRFCGSMELYHTASQMDLHFKTDDKVTARGFLFAVLLLSPGAGCGGLPCGPKYLERGNYTLLSKNFPHKHGTNLYCKWQLMAIEPTDQLSLTCSSFRLQGSDDSYKQCRFGSMSVKETHYCSTRAPSESAVGQLDVEFFSVWDGNGFNCTITVNAKP